MEELVHHLNKNKIQEKKREREDQKALISAYIYIYTHTLSTIPSILLSELGHQFLVLFLIHSRYSRFPPVIGNEITSGNSYS